MTVTSLKEMVEKLTIANRLTLIGIVAVIGMVTMGFIHKNSMFKIDSVADELHKNSKTMELLDGLSNSVFVEYDAALNYLKSATEKDKYAWQQVSKENAEDFTLLESVLPTKEMVEVGVKSRLFIDLFLNQIRVALLPLFHGIYGCGVL
ncbi:MAG TPA: hypothetical protein EYG66_05995, partial [Mariprofundaceae bacterium]|nr:hypothetical protein [Mariprofundaceae bacterium]